MRDHIAVAHEPALDKSGHCPANYASAASRNLFRIPLCSLGQNLKGWLALPLALAAGISGCAGVNWHEQRLKWFGDPSHQAAPASAVSRWSRADTNVDQFMKDRYDCLKDARHEYAVGAAYQGSGGYRQDSFVDCGILSSCLGARGYRLDPAGSLMPPENMTVRCR